MPAINSTHIQRKVAQPLQSPTVSKSRLITHVVNLFFVVLSVYQVSIFYIQLFLYCSVNSSIQFEQNNEVKGCKPLLNIQVLTLSHFIYLENKVGSCKIWQSKFKLQLYNFVFSQRFTLYYVPAYAVVYFASLSLIISDPASRPPPSRRCVQDERLLSNV